MHIIKQEYFPQRFSLLDSEKLKIYYINTGKVVEVVKLSDNKKLSKNIDVIFFNIKEIQSCS